MPTRRIVLAASLLLAPQARAHSFKLGSIAIGHAWALPSKQTDGQVFFPLINNGKELDALISARCDHCGLVELRKNNRYDDPAESEFMLDPGKPLPMRPTARHLRLVGLIGPLALGDSMKLTLVFQNAGEAEIEAMVADNADG